MTPHPKIDPAIGGVAMNRSPVTGGVAPSLGAVSPKRSRKRGPAGRNCVAGVIERSNCNASGSRNTR